MPDGLSFKSFIPGYSFLSGESTAETDANKTEDTKDGKKSEEKKATNPQKQESGGIFGFADSLSLGSTSTILNIADSLTLGSVSALNKVGNDLTNNSLGNATKVDKNTIFGGAATKARDEIETFVSSKKAEETEETDGKKENPNASESSGSSNILGKIIDATIGKAVRGVKEMVTAKPAEQKTAAKEIKDMSSDEIKYEIDHFDMNQPDGLERYTQLVEAAGHGPAGAAKTHAQSAAMEQQTKAMPDQMKNFLNSDDPEALKKMAAAMGAGATTD